ncbi:alpha-galactosidase (plasmid) [Paenibacillus rhizovicinus]|uniref:Alpha-galactosidase n=1 Tax=Paenibacillus rhizovicinus TaxID=2704463 RepID=A0A6C0PAW9_9BACL|nr:glycoside hydrolase family 36 protein [Paenibacillus rhizovicinus]QHW35515.1 alpha-galactosidase [Paenibacillus rhizovicinus]
MKQVTAGSYTVQAAGDPGEFRVSLTADSPITGVQLVKLTLEADRPLPPPSIKLQWSHPVVDIQGIWDTNASRKNKGIGSAFVSKSTSLAPVISLYSTSGRNRQTFAFSDALNPVKSVAWIIEETAEYECSVQLFMEPGAPIDHYSATLRIDTRDIPYYDSIREVGEWWAGMPGYLPSPVPDTARLPMYSTWYSFHQQVTPEEVEEQCRMAKELGCEAVIVDDGWQTSNNERGYAYCGDWEVSPERIPDMKAHVRRVHQLGMKYLLWYSVPFVGIHSKAWKRFEGKMLHIEDEHGAGVVDPRFPEVRDYLINVYEKALVEWELDGFKLDFVDNFYLKQGAAVELGGGRDYDSVPEAVDRLLNDVMERLRALKPDVMIEFRQSYIGPLMRKYGNIFRVADCPNDTGLNRAGTVDIRLLSGNTAAHADMMMWHPDDPPQSAALQLIHSMFGVPQISVKLDRVPESHRRMIGRWLSFWRQHRDVLLDGMLMPERPELLYPVVYAANERKLIAGLYANMVVRPPVAVPDEWIVVNGKHEDGIVLDLAADIGNRAVEIRDCFGNIVHSLELPLHKGLYQFAVPAAGTWTAIRKEGRNEL